MEAISSLNMRPELAGPNPFDRVGAESVPSSNGLSGPSQFFELPNGRHVGLRYFCVAAICVVRTAPLRFHIRHIFGLSSEKQMSGIDAVTDIASMQHKEVFWDGAKMNLPRYPMRGPLASARAARHYPITISREPGRVPKPAAWRLRDFLPETLFERPHFSHFLIISPWKYPGVFAWL